MSRTRHHGESCKPWVRRKPAGAKDFGATPAWWTRLFMSRPRRARNHLIERLILNGAVDTEDMALPLGNRKPHKYYW